MITKFVRCGQPMRMSDAAEQSVSGVDGRVRRRRRRWSEARKRLIVAESYHSGVSVVARRHDVNANLVFSWRRQNVRAYAADNDRMRTVPY